MAAVTLAITTLPERASSKAEVTKLQKRLSTRKWLGLTPAIPLRGGFLRLIE
jgi:hypothetical protein